MNDYLLHETRKFWRILLLEDVMITMTLSWTFTARAELLLLVKFSPDWEVSTEALVALVVENIASRKFMIAELACRSIM